MCVIRFDKNIKMDKKNLFSVDNNKSHCGSRTTPKRILSAIRRRVRLESTPAAPRLPCRRKLSQKYE